MLSNNKFGMEIKQFVIKTYPRLENRIPHYKLDKKVIIEKFNESLGKSTSALIDNGSDELSDNPVSSQPESEKNAPPAPDSPKPVSKKVPPPIPPKLDYLKISTNSSNTDDKQEPLEIPGPLVHQSNPSL